MSNNLIIKKPIIYKNRVEYAYELNGDWRKFLKNEKMFIELNFNPQEIPLSILYIPLLANILPISWVYDLNITVDELDKDFFESLKNIRNGYAKMYPSLNFGGRINCKKVIKNKSKNNLKTATLFSGGIDAFDTLLRHAELKPDLITVWGADISLFDNNGWNLVKQLNLKVANKFKLNFNFIKSNFKIFLNYKNVSSYVIKSVNDEWWHGFQHGLGILGLVAPLAYYYSYSNLFIASSFTKDLWGTYTCASDPIIDNNVKFCGCSVIHDGYDYNRQQKIANIVKYKKEHKISYLPIRVCWISDGGNNCCLCEKCTRTIAGIIAEKENPKDYGFDIDYRKFIKNLYKYSKYNYKRYIFIQKRFIENYSIDETPIELKKFRKFKLKSKAPYFIRVINYINTKFNRLIKKITMK